MNMNENISTSAIRGLKEVEDGSSSIELKFSLGKVSGNGRGHSLGVKVYGIDLSDHSVDFVVCAEFGDVFSVSLTVDGVDSGAKVKAALKLYMSDAQRRNVVESAIKRLIKAAVVECKIHLLEAKFDPSNHENEKRELTKKKQKLELINKLLSI